MDLRRTRKDGGPTAARATMEEDGDWTSDVVRVTGALGIYPVKTGTAVAGRQRCL